MNIDPTEIDQLGYLACNGSTVPLLRDCAPWFSGLPMGLNHDGSGIPKGGYGGRELFGSRRLCEPPEWINQRTKDLFARMEGDTEKFEKLCCGPRGNGITDEEIEGFDELAGIPDVYEVPVYVVSSWVAMFKTLLDHWASWCVDDYQIKAWSKPDPLGSDGQVSPCNDDAWAYFVATLNGLLQVELVQPLFVLEGGDGRHLRLPPQWVNDPGISGTSDQEISLPALWANQLAALVVGGHQPRQCEGCETWFVFHQGAETLRPHRDATFCSKRCMSNEMNRRSRARKKASR